MLTLFSLPDDQKEALRQLLTTGGTIANSVITKLAEQPITDIEQFSRLLDDFKFHDQLPCDPRHQPYEVHRVVREGDPR